MSIKRRLAALERGNGTQAETFLIDLLDELATARSEGREPNVRRATIRENTDVIQTLKKHGITLVTDTGENQW